MRIDKFTSSENSRSNWLKIGAKLLEPLCEHFKKKLLKVKSSLLSMKFSAGYVYRKISTFSVLGTCEKLAALHARAEKMIKNGEHLHYGDLMSKALNYMLNGWGELQNYRMNGH